MRICLDARFFGPRVGGGGLGRYVSELVTHLQQIDSHNEYTVLLKKENFHDFVVKKPNWSKKLVDVPWYSFKEQTAVPRAIAEVRPTFTHFPHWNVPLLTTSPFLLTIHDLILLEDPHSARATTKGPLVHAVKTAGFRVTLESAVYRARHIVAVSESTRAQILKRFRVKGKRVTTVYNGVATPASGKAIVLRDLGVTPPYILTVGNSYPHKNLDALVSAFALVQAARPYVQLVLAGKRDMFTERLLALADELEIPQSAVRQVNLPTDEELGALIRQAAVLAFPSRFEGFGLPPLEALSVGVPVVASDIAPLREVLGDAVAFVSPDDVEALATALLAALDDAGDEPTVLRRKRQAMKFSWEETARQTHEIYLSHGSKHM